MPEFKDIMRGLWLPQRESERERIAAAATNPMSVLKQSDFVDAAWYQALYDVPANMTADEHYLMHGAKHGADPNSLFRSRWYVDKHASVQESGLNPAIHYLLIGSPNGLRPNPLFDPAWYRATYPDVVAAGMEPVVHYLKFGAKELRNPDPDILTQWLPKVLDASGTGYANPLATYLDLVQAVKHGSLATNGRQNGT